MFAYQTEHIAFEDIAGTIRVTVGAFIATVGEVQVTAEVADNSSALAVRQAIRDAIVAYALNHHNVTLAASDVITTDIARG